MTDVTEAKAVTWCATSSLSIIKPTVFCSCRRRRVCPKLALQDFAHICASKPDGPQADVRMILHGASAVRCSLAQFKVTCARSGIVSPRLPLKETNAGVMGGGTLRSLREDHGTFPLSGVDTSHGDRWWDVLCFVLAGSEHLKLRNILRPTSLKTALTTVGMCRWARLSLPVWPRGEVLGRQSRRTRSESALASA